jgi:hypothetical protein
MLGPYNHLMPLTRQELIDYLYPQVNEFLKLQHAGEDARALELFDSWLAETLARLEHEGNTELWEAVFYRCTLLGANFRWRCTAIPDHEGRQRITRETLAALDRPALSEAGALSQRYAQVAAKITAYNDFDEPPSEAEMLAGIESLPDEYRDHQIWHPLSVLAFDHNMLALMELAFEYSTIAPHSKYPQAFWQRINLLYQIMSGKVSRRDVTETLGVLFLPTHFEEFRRRMLPRLEELGLVDAEIMALLAEREAEAKRGELNFNQPRLERLGKAEP